MTTDRNDNVVGRITPASRDTLDPAREPERWDALVARVVKAAEPELARRRGDGSVVRLRRWARPIAAAAASVAAVAGGTLFSMGMGAQSIEAQAPVLAEAILPEAMVTWIEYGESPDMDGLIVDFEGDEQP